MDATGTAITFETVAREAGVSRSWLYNQADLRAELERLRAGRRPIPAARPVPDRQRASDASLLRRLEAATERNRQLEAENRELRDAEQEIFCRHGTVLRRPSRTASSTQRTRSGTYKISGLKITPDDLLPGVDAAGGKHAGGGFHALRVDHAGRRFGLPSFLLP